MVCWKQAPCDLEDIRKGVDHVDLILGLVLIFVLMLWTMALSLTIRYIYKEDKVMKSLYGQS